MSLPVSFHSAARAEFDHAADWYEQQRSGLGQKFMTAVRRVLTRAANQPDFYPFIEKNVREGLVHGFPYVVLYRQESRRLSVLAVFHTSRNPAIWQRRI